MSPDLRRRCWAVGGVLLLLLVLAVAWQSLKPEALVASLRGLGESLGPGLAVAALALALVLAVPLGPLTLASQIALGPWLGSACVMAGALLAAAVSQRLGRSLGHELLLKLAGPKLRRLSESLERRGLLAVIALRLVPVAPFAIVNMVAGSTHLKTRDMLLGTAIGMLPGTVIMAVFTDQLMQALLQPGPGRWALLGGIVALIALGGWGLRRWMNRSDEMKR